MCDELRKIQEERLAIIDKFRDVSSNNRVQLLNELHEVRDREQYHRETCQDCKERK